MSQNFSVNDFMAEQIGDLNKLYDLITEFLVNYSFQLLGAVLVMIIGALVARKVGKLVLHFCTKHNLDITLSRFIASTTKITLILIVAVIALGKIGISIGPFVAAIGAVSLGAGLAVQGLLSNYSAGLNIVITRPFKVGDTITVQDVTGVVEVVKLAYTILEDEDGVRIMIPNRHIIGEIIHNSNGTRLAVTSIGIAYGSDIEAALRALHKVLTDLPEVDENVALLGVDGFGDSSINLNVRFWLPTKDFHSLRFKVNQAMFEALKNAGIQIPFPQREVRMLQS